MSVIFFLMVSLFAKADDGDGSQGTGMTSMPATTTSTKALDENPYRNYLLIQNNGAASVYVKFGSSQSAAEGIVISAGGAFEPTRPPRESLWVMSSTGSQALSIIEAR